MAADDVIEQTTWTLFFTVPHENDEAFSDDETLLEELRQLGNPTTQVWVPPVHEDGVHSLILRTKVEQLLEFIGFFKVLIDSPEIKRHKLALNRVVITPHNEMNDEDKESYLSDLRAVFSELPKDTTIDDPLPSD